MLAAMRTACHHAQTAKRRTLVWLCAAVKADGLMCLHVLDGHRAKTAERAALH